MKTLPYIIDDRTIIELLGAQNFTTKESAILELVKNAYDAQANTLLININRDDTDEMIIKLIDDGVGMNEDDIINKWMHVGKSDKGYVFKDQLNKERVYAGSKGVGRFALAKLGGKVEIETKRKDSIAIRWSTDWNTNQYEERKRTNLIHGTSIAISDLKDNWNLSQVKKLVDYLRRTYNDDSMKIRIEYEKEFFDVINIFHNPKIGVNFTNKITFKYSSMSGMIKGNVISDEFKDDLSLSNVVNTKKHEISIDIFSEMKRNKPSNKSFEEYNDILRKVGDFSVELYFSIDDSNTGDFEKFQYKHKKLSNRWENGIVLYRNAFSIASYEGKKDWIELNSRSRRSPAAASHPTGSWRVRYNQINGKIVLDKNKNSFIRELANRQAIEENEYFEAFIKIVHLGLTEFERFRQGIIRKIVPTKETDDIDKNEFIQTLRTSPSIINSLTVEQAKDVVKFISDLEDIIKDSKKEIKDVTNRFTYDIRVLNVLATLGLKAAAVAHENETKRNILFSAFDNIQNALKKYDLWEMLSDSEHTKYSNDNIPTQLTNAKKFSESVMTFMDIFLQEIEKNTFVSKEISIEEELTKIKKIWEDENSRLNINIENISFLSEAVLPIDILQVVFDNLILNSLQQNPEISLTIDIKFEVIQSRINFSYSDNGKGLDIKYYDNTRRILEPHESTRDDGHGLGMWIINNTVVNSGGEIEKILAKKGFEMYFNIGVENEQ